MSGFIRRYTDQPGVDVLGEIEGVVIIDSPPPGSVQGVEQGVACIVGEFADFTYATFVDASGVVTTKAQPVEIFGSQDLTEKLGGFDATIGQYGGDGGSGWLEVKNKTFARLVAVPVNLASSQGWRVFRELPTCTGATNPEPVVPLTAAVVPAGREFRSGANRVLNGKRVVFGEVLDFSRGVDGAMTTAAAAATQPFTSATAGWQTLVRPDGTIGAKKGDILVIGTIGGAGALGANAGTRRVVSVDSATQLTVESMTGATFAATTTAVLPFRLHIGSTADSGPLNSITEQAGYRIPARPIDATVAINVALTPAVAPPAATGTTWDPLSGLGARTAPVTGLVYTATIQAANAVNDATIDALYDFAIDSLLADDLPAREVNIVWPARLSNTIRTKCRAHELVQKANGIGRIVVIAPELDVVNPTTWIGDAAPGVGATRSQEVIYCAPGLQTFVREAVGITIRTADGLTTTDGILDTAAHGWMTSILSQLAPERNPGQASDPVETIMSNVVGIQRGVSGLGIGQYKAFKRKGVAAPRNDRTSGFIFESGITSSLTSGEQNINRRRMSFFIQDSLAARMVAFSKELLTDKLRDDILAEHVGFFEELMNPLAQRIQTYRLDSKSGNTKALRKAGIYVVIHEVEMLQTADVIVLHSNVGLGVIDILEQTAE